MTYLYCPGQAINSLVQRLHGEHDFATLTASRTIDTAPTETSGHGFDEVTGLSVLGCAPSLLRHRHVWTLLFQSLAMVAIPYGEGSALMSAIYGGGQLSIFVGWIMACALNLCVAISLASHHPTSADPYYWYFSLA